MIACLSDIQSNYVGAALTLIPFPSRAWTNQSTRIAPYTAISATAPIK